MCSVFLWIVLTYTLLYMLFVSYELCLNDFNINDSVKIITGLIFGLLWGFYLSMNSHILVTIFFSIVLACSGAILSLFILSDSKRKNNASEKKYSLNELLKSYGAIESRISKNVYLCVLFDEFESHIIVHINNVGKQYKGKRFKITKINGKEIIGEIVNE